MPLNAAVTLSTADSLPCSSQNGYLTPHSSSHSNSHLTTTISYLHQPRRLLHQVNNTTTHPPTRASTHSTRPRPPPNYADDADITKPLPLTPQPPSNHRVTANDGRRVTDILTTPPRLDYMRPGIVLWEEVEQIGWASIYSVSRESTVSPRYQSIGC